MEMLGELVLSDGSSFTLASTLGTYIAELERRFGPRDHTYTILGIEFRDALQPDHRFVEGGIVIRLTKAAMTSKAEAHYQLSHESVHLLDPTGTPHVNVLEEGLAESFAVEHLIDGHQPTKDERYVAARACYERVRDAEPRVITTLRARGIKMSAVSLAQLREICRGALASDLAALAERWSR